MTRAEAAVLGGQARAAAGDLTIASAIARSARAEQQARLFASYLDASVSLKEAAWLARMSYRTARRYAKKLGR